jgi:KDO2-lipid IV(A) lauroyltransferase
VSKTGTVSNKALKVIIVILNKLSSFFPRRISLFLGGLFGRIIYLLAKVTPYRSYIAKNIKITLPLSEFGAKLVAKKHVISLTKNIVDFLRFDSIDLESLEKIITFKNPEFFQEALAEDKGVILVSAHFGCWELIGAALSLKLKAKVNVLVQKPANPLFDELFFNYREKVGVKTHYNNNNISTIRPLFRALENKECLGFLVDQHGESEDAFGFFFNKVVSIPSGPAHFAYKTGAPIVPVFIRRNRDDRHEIIFYPAIHANEGDKELEIHRVSQEIYKVIEKNIKEKPDEWLWMYDRWNKLSIDAREIASNMKDIKERKERKEDFFLNEKYK